MPRTRTLLVALLVCAAPAAAPTSASAATTGRVVVLMRPGAPSLTASSATVRLADARLGMRVLTPGAGETAGHLARRLRHAPGVASAQVEGRMAPFTIDPARTRVDTSGRLPAGTAIQWTLPRLHVPDVGARPSKRVRVAIIDSGADAGHPDLRRAIAATGSSDAEYPDPSTDEDGHGTHVASLACATPDNGVGLAGTGGWCDLLIVKSDLRDASVAWGIRAAVDAGAGVINMSFGASKARAPVAAIRRAINYAVEKDVILVAAAPNEPKDRTTQPASLLQPRGTGQDIAQGRGLVVTSANFADARASFAAFGSGISLAAYGAATDTVNADGTSTVTGVFGAFPRTMTTLDTGTRFPPPGQAPCGCRASLGAETAYASMAGNSMAAPEVAGIAARVRAAAPRAKLQDLLKVIKQTASRPAGTAGWSDQLGWGIVNARAAVIAARKLR